MFIEGEDDDDPVRIREEELAYINS